jgi:REP element-mobilizing transposase RayT
MIIGYHVVFGAYGFWLPNDPRGSWSNFVGSWELFRFGPATKTSDRRSLAHRPHDPQLRLAAKAALARPAVKFSDAQAAAIGDGFASYVERSGLAVWACAIMSDHVHLVIGKPHIKIEQVVIQLKGDATQSLMKRRLHPFGGMKDADGRPPKCFARGQWKVFLDPGDVPRAIKYVEDNPAKEGKERQWWDFVVVDSCPAR